MKVKYLIYQLFNHRSIIKSHEDVICGLLYTPLNDLRKKTESESYELESNIYLNTFLFVLASAYKRFKKQGCLKINFTLPGSSSLTSLRILATPKRIEV